MKAALLFLAVFYTGVIFGSFVAFFWVCRPKRSATRVEKPRMRQQEIRSMAIDLNAHPKVRPIDSRAVLCDRDLPDHHDYLARIRAGGL